RRGRGDENLAGVVRVTASEGFMRPLVRVLAAVRLRAPALTLELSSESRLEDLARREADIGLRIVSTSSPSLVEKRAGRVRLAVFAARSYVERRLPSAHLGRGQARHHDWVGLDRTIAKLPSERWMRDCGAERFVLRTSSPNALEEAVSAGMGLGVLGEEQGAAQRLVRIDTEDSPPPVDVFVVFHRDARRTPRIAAVLRAIEAELRRALV
ncbi:MAG: hypothetical protein IAG13_27380, partial [Deltaproteobacteria bacterium]|nr:hypothetical protein [Nannocystaceae bacterium]